MRGEFLFFVSVFGNGICIGVVSAWGSSAVTAAVEATGVVLLLLPLPQPSSGRLSINFCLFRFLFLRLIRGRFSKTGVVGAAETVCVFGISTMLLLLLSLFAANAKVAIVLLLPFVTISDAELAEKEDEREDEE